MRAWQRAKNRGQPWGKNAKYYAIGAVPAPGAAESPWNPGFFKIRAECHLFHCRPQGGAGYVRAEKILLR